MPYPVAAARGQVSGGGGYSPAALLASRVAAWKLDETSGTRADSIGASTLTDDSSVGSATGLIYPLAASFVAASEDSLSCADSAALSTSDIDFWLSAWLRPGALTDSPFVGKVTADSASGYEYALYLISTGRASFVTGNGSAISSVASAASSVALNAWHLVVGWHKASTQRLYISVNGGTPVDAARSQAPADTAKPFVIGGVISKFLTGRVGPVEFGKDYTPTLDDLTYMYNGGLGRA